MSNGNCLALRVGTIGVGVVAAVAAISMATCSGGAISMAKPTIGFWYASGSLVLPAAATTRLGSPLNNEEEESIKQLSRMEIERAFSGLGINVTTERSAFWRVEVLQSLPVRRSQRLPKTGESLALGPLGGMGTVGVDIVVLKAIQYAPARATRARVIEAVGRGIGRVAVHEFIHQMLGVAAAHNDGDDNSYEYGSPDRASQYYGQLHWTTAWPLLQRKFGQ